MSEHARQNSGCVGRSNANALFGTVDGLLWRVQRHRHRRHHTHRSNDDEYVEHNYADDVDDDHTYDVDDHVDDHLDDDRYVDDHYGTRPRRRRGLRRRLRM